MEERGGRSSERAEGTPDNASDRRDKLNEDGDVGDLGGECKLAREVDILSDLILAIVASFSTWFSFRECHIFCVFPSSSWKKGLNTSAYTRSSVTGALPARDGLASCS